MNPSRVAQPATRRPAITPRKPSVTRVTPFWHFGSKRAARSNPAVTPSSSSRVEAKAAGHSHLTSLDPALAQALSKFLSQTLGNTAPASPSRAAQTDDTAGLTFLQFLRAYIRAFAAGLGCYVLLSELASGHWNVLSMMVSHIFLFAAAPFYALMLAPGIFGMYRALASFALTSAQRAYIVGLTLGTLLIVPRVLQGKFLLDAHIRSDLVSLTMLVAGGLAAYVFNREIKKVARPAAAGG